MESTARVVLSARAGAPVVLSAGLDALVSPFLADEVGEGKRVFRYVGLQLVSADAAVGQGFLTGEKSAHGDHQLWLLFDAENLLDRSRSPKWFREMSAGRSKGTCSSQMHTN